MHETGELACGEDVGAFEASMLHVSVRIVMDVVCMKIILFRRGKYID